jgi:hypothetical protein
LPEAWDRHAAKAATSAALNKEPGVLLQLFSVVSLKMLYFLREIVSGDGRFPIRSEMRKNAESKGRLSRT